MDLIKIGHFYINHIIKALSSNAGASVIPGSNINVLLLDDHTTSIVSIIASQSELLQNNIFLIDKISNVNRDKLRHLNCIIFVSSESVGLICDELKFPKYKKYSVFFSNFLKKSQLEKLAQYDDLELISRVEEIFWDYLIVNESLFLMTSINKKLINKELLTILLSLKTKPIIRFENNSDEGLRLSNELYYEMSNNSSSSYQLFSNFPKVDNKSLVLVLDRKNDPLTPLLTPWTYQSMVHEYLRIDKNIVDLTDYLDTNDNDDELTKIILNVETDKFFQDSMYLNFADLSDKISTLVNNYKLKTNNTSQLTSINDLKNFLQDYPEFKKLSHNVNKHITITSELTKQINKNNLFEISQVEQNLSIGKENDYSNHIEDFENIKNLLLFNKIDPNSNNGSFQISNIFKLKLIIIYALKYENYSGNQINYIVTLLKNNYDIEDEKIDVIKYILKKSGSRQRLLNDSNSTNSNTNQPGFNFNHNLNIGLSMITPIKNTNNLISSLKKLNINNNNNDSNNVDYDYFDYENEENPSIYMQHRPRLLYILQNIISRKLGGQAYPILNPFTSNSTSSTNNGLSYISNNTSSINNERFQDIIVYMIGGITYEESRLVGLLNKKYKSHGIRILVGSNKIINSEDYINDLIDQQKSEDVKHIERNKSVNNNESNKLFDILNNNKDTGNQDSFFGDNLL